jgi:hypothetical protein
MTERFARNDGPPSPNPTPLFKFGTIRNTALLPVCGENGPDPL